MSHMSEITYAVLTTRITIDGRVIFSARIPTHGRPAEEAERLLALPGVSSAIIETEEQRECTVWRLSHTMDCLRRYSKEAESKEDETRLAIVS